MQFLRGWQFAAAILLVALVLRLAGAAWWQSRLPEKEPFYFGDSASYWYLAADIADGREYEYQGAKIFRTPGYPLALAPLFALSHEEPDVFTVRAWNALWGTLAVAGAMLLARQLFDERVALVAGVLAAILPEAIAGSVFILSEAVFVPVMLGQLCLATRAAKEKHLAPTSIFSFASGVIAGAATLIRPSWLLFTPLFVLVQFFVLKRKENVEHRLAMALLPLLGLIIALLPWWIRNYRIAGEFVATTSEVGASLYDGLNPKADGSSEMSFKPALEAEFNRIDARASHREDKDYPAAREVRLDHFYRDRALVWARENPSRFVQLAGIKFLRLWNILPNAADFQSNFGRWLIALSYGPVMILAIVGLTRIVRQPPPSFALTLTLALLPAAYFTLLHIIFVSSLRYRLPALMPLLILSAFAAVWLYDRYFTNLAPNATTTA